METHRLRLGSAFTLAFIILQMGSISAVAARNHAFILTAGSDIPSSGDPNSTIPVVVRVQNKGSSTWTTGAMYRLGAKSSNLVDWSSFGCGGYSNSTTDSRAFLCYDVPPRGTHDFRFDITLPASGVAKLSVQMVQDGVEWFGKDHAWDISIIVGNLPDVVIDSVRTDPSSPTDGEATQFITVVRNQGDSSTPAGTVIGVGYFIDGQYVTYGYSDSPLDPGASTTILSQGGSWTAVAGSHELIAFVDDVNRFQESNEDNNTLSTNFTVGSGCSNNVLATPDDRWKLEIFKNRKLSGMTVEQRYDAEGTEGFIFDWGWGAPSSCANENNFGVRFSRTFSVVSSGAYIFRATADDGVRLWVDGTLLIDRWIDQARTTYQATTTLSAGFHDIRMDYYERGGVAYAALSWRPQSSGGGDPELYAMNIDPANPNGNPDPQALKDVGVRWLRIEWKSDPGYPFYDARIADYRNAGLKVMLLIDYASVPPKPDWDASDADWIAYLERFDAGIQELALHYGDGVDAWQIWNEPDLMAPVVGYDPGVPADHYGIMLRDAVTTIRAHSTRPVVVGGLASANPDYLTQAINAAGGLTADYVGVHPYGRQAPDGWPSASWGFGRMSDLFDSYLAFGKPLWVTESGINDGDTSLYAQYLENVYALARDEYPGQVQRIFWFCWSDGMVPPFGLLDGFGNPKDTYYAYKSIAPSW